MSFICNTLFNFKYAWLKTQLPPPFDCTTFYLSATDSSTSSMCHTPVLYSPMKEYFWCFFKEDGVLHPAAWWGNFYLRSQKWIGLTHANVPQGKVISYLTHKIGIPEIPIMGQADAGECRLQTKRMHWSAPEGRCGIGPSVQAGSIWNQLHKYYANTPVNVISGTNYQFNTLTWSSQPALANDVTR